MSAPHRLALAAPTHNPYVILSDRLSPLGAKDLNGHRDPSARGRLTRPRDTDLGYLVRGLRPTFLCKTTRLAPLTLALALLPAVSLAERTDVVVLKNGDHITGEVKQLARGRLEFKTDKAGTILIEWDVVAQLTSENFFEVLNEEGLRFYGALIPPDVAETLTVGFLDTSTNLPLENIAAIERLRQSFWSRIKGSLDLGLSFTKADTKTEWNTKITADYRTKKRRLSMTIDSQFRTQENVADFDRQDYSFNFQRLYVGRWLWTGFAAGQRNTELSLDFRLIAGAGAGFHIVRTVEQDLIITAGLGVSQESFSDDRSDSTSAEALLVAKYDLYALGGKDFTTTASLGLFPSLSVSKRIRLEADLDFRKELFSDFYISIRFFDSFDSGVEDSRNDFGITTSIGLTW